MQAFLFFIQLFMTCSCVEISNSFLFLIPFLPSEIMGKKADVKAKTTAAVKKAAIKANQSKTKKTKKNEPDDVENVDDQRLVSRNDMASMITALKYKGQNARDPQQSAAQLLAYRGNAREEGAPHHSIAHKVLVLLPARANRFQGYLRQGIQFVKLSQRHQPGQVEQSSGGTRPSASQGGVPSPSCFAGGPQVWPSHEGQT